MDRLLGVAILAIVTALVFLAMFLAWRRRRTAASHLTADQPFADATVLARHEGLYVATTHRANHLERVFASGLTYRARITVIVFDAGLVLSPRGERDTWIRWSRIDGLGRSQVTIDRVVESGGLTRIDWNMSDGSDEVPVSSFLRLDPSSHDALTLMCDSALLDKEDTPT